MRNLIGGTTRLGIIVSAAPVPTVLCDNMEFAGNMAETEPFTRDSGDRV